MFHKNDLERNASGYFIGWSTVKEPIKHDLTYQGKGKINFTREFSDWVLRGGGGRLIKFIVANSQLAILALNNE